MSDTETGQSENSEQRLSGIRDAIDRVDRDIQHALNRRVELVQEVAEVKLLAGGDGAVYYRPEREAQVLRRVKKDNPGPLEDATVARIFREIMSACLALEKPVEVAYLGPEGTYSQSAALKQFGSSMKGLPVASIEQIFSSVERGDVSYAVVPVENSTEGPINQTLDCLRHSPLTICGEVELPIHHNLLAKTPDTKPRVIYSHEQSLAQCRNWLLQHYPNVEQIAVSSNAEAAKLASQQPNCAAIAGDSAALVYQLHILESNIEDSRDNTTRFLVLGDQDIGVSGDDKTSIIVSTKNRPGALAEILQLFQHNQINLAKIVTRPSAEATWAYMFFIDFEGHRDDQSVRSVLDEMERKSIAVKWLGSYPVAAI
ncbi:MAG: prephenate dehydratase [Pseudomonadales bacterium]|nr:prephenate dehydratase [Pseudomonadales bacterium]